MNIPTELDNSQTLFEKLPEDLFDEVLFFYLDVKAFHLFIQTGVVHQSFKARKCKNILQSIKDAYTRRRVIAYELLKMRIRYTFPNSTPFVVVCSEGCLKTLKSLYNLTLTYDQFLNCVVHKEGLDKQGKLLPSALMGAILNGKNHIVQYLISLEFQNNSKYLMNTTVLCKLNLVSYQLPGNGFIEISILHAIVHNCKTNNQLLILNIFLNYICNSPKKNAVCPGFAGTPLDLAYTTLIDLVGANECRHKVCTAAVACIKLQRIGCTRILGDTYDLMGITPQKLRAGETLNDLIVLNIDDVNITNNRNM